jgi:Ca2+-binding EF-hand superfamily protein
MGAAASVRHLYKEALDWFKVYIDSETYEADFKLMDKNEDGLISLMELQKFIGDKCAEDKGWEVLNDGQVLVNAHRNAAQFEHVQGANKKDVNLGEFKALLVHLFAAALLHAHFNNADTWEDIVDIDGNNKKPMKLNFEKYRLACKTFCQAHAGEDLSEAQIKEDFDYLDKNGFGYIGFTEVSKGILAPTNAIILFLCMVVESLILMKF